MGVRGRKPKPTQLKVLSGNPGKRALNKNEPKPKAEAPRCPIWLSREAKKEWRRVVPELARLGLLTKVDRTALAGYCQAYARWRQAEEVLQEKGLTMEIETKSGAIYEQQRPEVAIAHKCLKEIKDFCAEFGLTPSARSRLEVPKQKEADPFEEFLRRGPRAQ